MLWSWYPDCVLAKVYSCPKLFLEGNSTDWKGRGLLKEIVYCDKGIYIGKFVSYR